MTMNIISKQIELSDADLEGVNGGLESSTVTCGDGKSPTIVFDDDYNSTYTCSDGGSITKTTTSTKATTTTTTYPSGTSTTVVNKK